MNKSRLFALFLAGGGLTLSLTAFAVCAERAVMPGDPDWFGPAWQVDSRGTLTGAVEITPYAGGFGDHWLQVRVIAADVDTGWSEGPYGPEALLSPTPIPLTFDADPTGLVQVIVLVEVTDPDTGERLASTASAPAYASITDGVAQWYDPSAASAAIDAAAVAQQDVAVDAGYVDESLVGRLVTR